MKIIKEQIIEIVNNPKVICWSDILVELNLLPLFEKYLKDHNKKYNIDQIKMGKTLMNKIDDILKERIIRSKDKRIKHLRNKYKLNAYSMDCLQSQPTEAKEDINYMELEDL